MNAGELRAALGFAQDQVVFVYSGSFHPRRRIDVLLQGFIPVAEKYGNKVKLMMLGMGSDFSRLVSMADSSGLKENVIFPGLIPFDQIPMYLSCADIGLAYVPDTSEYNSQPPLKTVEMLAVDLPVIATDTIGNRIFIKDGYNGLITGDDAESLAQGMIRLIENKELQNLFRKEARNSINKEYDYSEIVNNKVIPAYEKIRRK